MILPKLTDTNNIGNGVLISKGHVLYWLVCYTDMLCLLVLLLQTLRDVCFCRLMYSGIPGLLNSSVQLYDFNHCVIKHIAVSGHTSLLL